MQQPIGNPMFWMLEVLIIVMMPAMVALFTVVFAWAPVQVKAFGLFSLVFMGLLAGVTCSVHFLVLTLSRHSSFIGQPWTPQIFSFTWPSVVYALDILAWDVFFALSIISASLVFRGKGLAVWVRILMIISGVLSLAGLSGVAAGNMQLRNIGIVGYVGVFLMVAVLLSVFFYRTECPETSRGVVRV